MQNLSVKLIYIEGMDSTINENLSHINPDDNPYDMLIIGFVKGGEVIIKGLT